MFETAKIMDSSAVKYVKITDYIFDDKRPI